MLSFLKSVFGSDITIAEYSYTNDTPYYIRDGYTPKFLIWNQGKCIILKPNDSNWRLPTLKKQLKKFQELCKVPCVWKNINCDLMEPQDCCVVLGF